MRQLPEFSMELPFDPQNPKYSYVTTVGEAADALKAIEKEQILGLDTETTGFDPYVNKLLLVIIGTRTLSYVFDARILKLKNIPQLKELLENTKIIKLMHNGKFDYGFLKAQADISVNNIFDTMLAESVLTAGLVGKSASLKELIAKYTQTVAEKETRQTFINQTGKITPEQLVYASKDTLYLFPIFDAQLVALQKENLVNIAKLEFAVTRTVAEMELTGIYIDTKKWKAIIAKLKLKRDEFYKQFQEQIRPFYGNNQVDLFGNNTDSINMNSNQQLMDLFNNKLKLNVPSTGDAILESINHPIAKALRDYRGYEKLISAFGETLLAKMNPVTGRFHPDFNQLGAATGRFSCRSPNLQQIPRNSEEVPFRTCFNPRPGYKYVVADYSNFEMRILADLSGDEKMLNALNNGLDIHSYTASLMFGLEYSKDFKKLHPQLRQIAKPIGFGLMYGMGPVGLIGRIRAETGKDITKEESEEYIKKFFSSYPSVKGFLEKTANQAVERGFSKTPAGRKRWYTLPEPTDPDYRKKISQIQREAKNHPIQGTNADAIKYALVFLQERLKKDNIDGSIILAVHDEVVSEVREDQAEAWSEVQSAEMVRAGSLFLKKVQTVSEPFVGDVWEH